MEFDFDIYYKPKASNRVVMPYLGGNSGDWDFNIFLWGQVGRSTIQPLIQKDFDHFIH